MRARVVLQPSSMEEILTTRVGYLSVIGNSRSSNEDRCYVDPRRNVFLVADGIGGYLGGEQASQIVAETAPRALVNALQQECPEAPAARSALRDAIFAAQRAIAACAEGRPEYQKMGSTVLLAVLVQHDLHVGHVGDSRAYLVRSGKIRQLTTDQTYVQLLVASGAISTEEARSHPFRNILLNSLSVGEMEEAPEIVTATLQAGDRILLATDGLTDGLDDEALRAIIAAAPDPQTAADQLVRKALENDSKDNITCVVVELQAVYRPAASLEPVDATTPPQPCLE